MKRQTAEIKYPYGQGRANKEVEYEMIDGKLVQRMVSASRFPWLFQWSPSRSWEYEPFVKKTRFQGLSRTFLVFSVVTLLVFVLSHFARLDILMLATIYPVFSWLVVGLFLTVWVVAYPRVRWGLVVAWVACVLLASDSPQNLIRAWIPPTEALPETLVGSDEDALPVRVVSLNCKGEPAAVSELVKLSPDVILLQESVHQKQLQKLVHESFPSYTAVGSGDATMLVRGTVQPFQASHKKLAPRYEFCRVRLANGALFNAVSVHLQASPREFDFSRLAIWQTFAELKQVRRQQLHDIHSDVMQRVGDTPTVIGGDFNAPAGDQIYDVLEREFRDSWAEAGRGWGKTSLNNYPVHRIDQVWITRQFAAKNVTAEESSGSDHRMVVCDLWLKQPKQVTVASNNVGHKVR